MKWSQFCNRSSKGFVQLLALILYLPVTGIGFALAANDSPNLLTGQLKSHNAHIAYQAKSGRVGFISTAPRQAIAVAGTRANFSAQENALVITRTYGPLFGIEHPDRQLSLSKQTTRPDGRTMVRFQQTHQGLPVLGAELVVNMDAQQRLLAMNGITSQQAGLVTDIVASVDAAQSIDTALKAVAKWHNVDSADLQASPAELKIYDPSLLGPGTGPQQLVWHITISSTALQPIRELVLVNAQRGFIALHFNQIHTAKDRLTHDSGGSMGNYYNLPGTLVCDEADGDGCSTGANPEADAAHQYSGDTYDFLQQHHGRDSLDGNGFTLISSVDFCPWSFDCPFVNAFWDGYQMVYGKGMVADDVTGHEIIHGFTEHTANLFYFYQSGAINESLSDMWGEFIDLTNSSGDDLAADRWYLGEDLLPLIGYGPYRGAIRSMSDPTLYGDPDKMSSPLYWFKSLDNGGVHFNSGINNKAVYLMTDGDTFNNITVKGIGIDKVAHIYYEAVTTMLTSGSGYHQLYAALNQSCNNLIGTKGISSDDCVEVSKALDAVEMNQEPFPGFTPQAAACTGTGNPNYVLRDDLESGLADWTIKNSRSFVGWGDSNTNYIYGNFTSSGKHALYSLGDYSAVSDQTAQISVVVPPVNPYLHFSHAYEFENSGGTFFDGGVVEYSLDGETWLAMDELYEAGQDYNGVLIGTNPLAGRKAYVGASHGYVSSRFNLSGLAGKQIQLRWRHATDDGYTFLGWYVDDVSIYACNTSNNAPTAAKLIAPADKAVINDTSVTFEWQASSDADGDPVTETVLICEGINCTPGMTAVSYLRFAANNALLAGMGGSGILLLGLLSIGRLPRRTLSIMLLAGSLLLLTGCPFDNKHGGTDTEAVNNKSQIVFDIKPGTHYSWIVRSSDDKGGVTDSVVQSFTVN